MNPTNYLFAAYTAIWIILAVYLFSLQARQEKLRDEIERLKSMLQKSGSMPEQRS